MPTWELAGPLMLALGGLITAIGALGKVLAEVRGMRMEQDRQGIILDRHGRSLDDVHGQTVNDHVTNFREDLDTVRDMIQSVADATERLERGKSQHDAELGRIHRSQIALAESVGQMGERLAATDMEDRTAARDEHKRFWEAIRATTPTKETP